MGNVFIEELLFSRITGARCVSIQMSDGAWQMVCRSETAKKKI